MDAKQLQPTEQEIAAAKLPHDIFLSNLIINHILLFTGIATMGLSYMYLLVVVPILSVTVLAYIFYRASQVSRAQSEFVYIHWQVARHWSRLFALVLGLFALIALLGWLAYRYLGLMPEAIYGLIGGFGILPTLVMVLVLIVIGSDSLHHARTGRLPNWARNKFLNQ